MRFPRCLVTGIAFLVLVGAASCSSNYQPPNHTYTGYPAYVGVGVELQDPDIFP